jgi:hypothetical protein
MAISLSINPRTAVKVHNPIDDPFQTMFTCPYVPSEQYTRQRPSYMASLQDKMSILQS